MQASPSPSEAHERSLPAHARKRVLVVDDDEIIRGFLSEALEDEGYDVQTAANGREALAVLGGWTPRLILLDLMMPEMDGWTFRAEQRSRDGVNTIPVIVLSAVRDLGTRAGELGAVALFSKPFDLDELLAAIRKVTGTDKNGLR